MIESMIMFILDIWTHLKELCHGFSQINLDTRKWPPNWDKKNWLKQWGNITQNLQKKVQLTKIEED